MTDVLRATVVQSGPKMFLRLCKRLGVVIPVALLFSVPFSHSMAAVAAREEPVELQEPRPDRPHRVMGMERLPAEHSETSALRIPKVIPEARKPQWCCERMHDEYLLQHEGHGAQSYVPATSLYVAE